MSKVLYFVCRFQWYANANDNDNANIISTIKNRKLYVPVITLSARDNQNLSKPLSKRVERSVYSN